MTNGPSAAHGGSGVVRHRAFAGRVAAIGAIGVSALALGAGAPAALAADDCSNAQFRTGVAANLPDCRAYERVSPPDNESYGPAGVGVNFQPQIAKARADGNRLIFTSAVSTGVVQRAGYGGLSRSTRTADGWKTVGLVTTEGEVDLDLGGQVPIVSYPSDDVSRAAFRTKHGLGGPNPGTNNGGATYLSALDGAGPPTWLSQPTIGGPIPSAGNYGSTPLGGSPDLSTAYFTFDGVLTNAYGDSARTEQGLYMNRNGVLSPAGRLPSGNVDPGGTMPAGSGQTYYSDGTLFNASAIRKSVSRDGSRLFFVTPVGGGDDAATVRQLYVQQDGGPGRLISKDQAGNPAATGVTGLVNASNANVGWIGKGFAFPSADGSAVLFRSTSALAAGAPADSTLKTYRARITDAAVTVEYLPQVDGAPLAITDDATRILYAENPSLNTYTIKLWDGRPGGATHTLASSSSGTGTWLWLTNVRLTPDGSTVLFDSSGEIVPGLVMPTLPGANAPITQTYRWSIGEVRPTCVSCRTDGLPFGRFGAHSANLAAMYTDNIAFPEGKTPDVFNQGTFSRQQGISDDGRRVFFDAIDPLVPEDTNGQRDVYMWDDGQVHLITSGKGTAPAFLIDSSASGDDVFFTTMEPLVAGDHNDDYDVYDARVDGGIAPKVVPSCTADDCQGDRGPAPNGTLPTSSLLAPVTAGTERLLPEPAKKAVGLRITQGKSTTTRVVLRVRTPGAGKIRTHGKGLRTIDRKAKRSTTYTVKAKLTSGARSTLRRKGRVTVNARVRFTPSAGKAVTKSVSVTVKRAKHTNRKGR